MPNVKEQFSHADPTSAVDRACEIARELLNTSRGNYETDKQCIEAVARKSRLTPAILRRFLQPCRRPKEVGLSVWTALQAAYRAQLEQQLAHLQDEIERLEACSPNQRAVLDLLDDAKNLVRKIEGAASSISSERGE